MIQRHSIILWKKADRKNKSFEEISKEAYEVLNIFQNYPKELRPNYLTAKSKKEVKEFEWNFQNFVDLLKKGINKEGDLLFEDLGYSVSFFSSLDKKDSCSFEILAGNKEEQFYNSIIVDLPLSLNLYDKEIADTIKNLFKMLVQTYMPFWGCISNEILSDKFEKFLEGNVPTMVHWMNYWSEDMIQEIGMERIQKCLEQNTGISFEKGILTIKDTAIDVNQEIDMEFFNELQTCLFY